MKNRSLRSGAVNGAVVLLAVVSILASLLPAVAADPAATALLTDEQRRALDRGEAVTISRAVPNWRWPEVTAYRRVAAAPAEVAAVHADFNAHTSWSPNIVVSRVVERPSPNTRQVFFEYDTPGPNEQYTLAITMRRAEHGYITSWELVKARWACRLSGALLAAPIETDTLLAITNRVDPCKLGTVLGSSDTVAESTRRTATALADHVTRLKAEQPAHLAELVRAFTAAVR